jgi:hypothetical protein
LEFYHDSRIFGNPKDFDLFFSHHHEPREYVYCPVMETKEPIFLQNSSQKDQVKLLTFHQITNTQANTEQYTQIVKLSRPTQFLIKELKLNFLTKFSSKISQINKLITDVSNTFAL